MRRARSPAAGAAPALVSRPATSGGWAAITSCLRSTAPRPLHTQFGYYTVLSAAMGCRVVAWEPVPLFSAFLRYALLRNGLTHAVQVRLPGCSLCCAAVTAHGRAVKRRPAAPPPPLCVRSPPRRPCAHAMRWDLAPPTARHRQLLCCAAAKPHKLVSFTRPACLARRQLREGIVTNSSGGRATVVVPNTGIWGTAGIDGANLDK